MSGSVEVILTTKCHHKIMLTVIFSLCVGSVNFHPWLPDHHASLTLARGRGENSEMTIFDTNCIFIWFHLQMASQCSDRFQSNLMHFGGLIPLQVRVCRLILEGISTYFASFPASLVASVDESEQVPPTTTTLYIYVCYMYVIFTDHGGLTFD